MRALRLLPAILLLLGPANVLAGDSSSNEYVRLDARPASATMRAGTSGLIELRFFPADGIHINVDPPVEFLLDSAAALTLKGRPAMTTDSRTGYLSAAVPVKQKVTLPGDLRPGPLPVRGTVTYFFCSDREGWCNRQKQPVEFTIMVTR